MPNPISAISINFRDSIGARWGTAIGSRHTSAKSAARAFGVAVVTAEKWLAGQPPQNKHMQTAVDLHGPAILTEVHAPGHAVVPILSPEARLATAIEAADKLSKAAQELRALIERIERGE
jgi:hypothetical protein